MAHAHEEERYWNEEGGNNWVRYIDRVERMLDGMTAILADAVAAKPGERILDVGCGGGPTTAGYAEAVGATGHVLGADISEPILELARSRYGDINNIEFVTADAGSYAFEPASFDVFTSRFGVMFFPDPVAAFSNIRKALKPDGRVCFMCWRPIKENPWMGEAAQAAFEFVTPPEKPEPGAPGPFSLGETARTQELLSAAGFRDIEFVKIDDQANLGTVEHALEWLSNMGPAAKPLQEADEASRNKAMAAMRQVFEQKLTGEGVIFPAATWIVNARP